MNTLPIPRYHKVEPIYKSFPVFNPQTSLEQAINAVFPQTSEESNIIRTRRILGKNAYSLSDEQIETIVAEFQFLANTWLDEFEKEIFKGLTLKQVLNEG